MPVIAIPRANTTTMASSHLLCNTFPIQTSCNRSSKSNISSFKPSGSLSFCQKLQFQRTPVVKATRKQLEVCTSSLESFVVRVLGSKFWTFFFVCLFYLVGFAFTLAWFVVYALNSSFELLGFFVLVFFGCWGNLAGVWSWWKGKQVGGWGG